MQRHIYDNNRCKTRAVKCPEVKKKILYNRKMRDFLFLRKTGAGAAAPQKNLSAADVCFGADVLRRRDFENEQNAQICFNL